MPSFPFPPDLSDWVRSDLFSFEDPPPWLFCGGFFELLILVSTGTGANFRTGEAAEAALSDPVDIALGRGKTRRWLCRVLRVRNRVCVDREWLPDATDQSMYPSRSALDCYLVSIWMCARSCRIGRQGERASAFWNGECQFGNNSSVQAAGGGLWSAGDPICKRSIGKKKGWTIDENGNFGLSHRLIHPEQGSVVENRVHVKDGGRCSCCCWAIMTKELQG